MLGRIVGSTAQPTLLHADDGLPRGVHGAADARVSRASSGCSPRLFPGAGSVVGLSRCSSTVNPLVDVWTGWSDRAGEAEWTADTGAMVFSGTKGVATTVIHRPAGPRELLDYDVPVAEYWPEFGANGKSKYHRPRRAAAPIRAVAPEGRQGRRSCWITGLIEERLGRRAGRSPAWVSRRITP